MRDMKTLPNDKAENGLLDSKIRGGLNRTFAIYNPPPNGKQQLLHEILHPTTQRKKATRFWNDLIDFLMLPNEDPDSVAIFQTFALSRARAFGFPGVHNLHMI